VILYISGTIYWSRSFLCKYLCVKLCGTVILQQTVCTCTNFTPVNEGYIKNNDHVSVGSRTWISLKISVFYQFDFLLGMKVDLLTSHVFVGVHGCVPLLNFWTSLLVIIKFNKNIMPLSLSLIYFLHLLKTVWQRNKLQKWGGNNTIEYNHEMIQKHTIVRASYLRKISSFY
jgi:hypothetical protein